MPDAPAPSAAPVATATPGAVVPIAGAARGPSHAERMSAALAVADAGPDDAPEPAKDGGKSIADLAKAAKAGETPAEATKDKPAAAEPEKKPAEPEKKPDGAAFKALRKAEAALATEKANIERAKAEVNAQASAHATELASGREAVKALSELQQLAKENPAEVIRRLGLDWDKATRAMLEADTPEAKLAAIEARLAQRETGEQEAKTKAEEDKAKAIAERNAQIEQTFVAAVRDGSEQYPLLGRYTDAGLIKAGHFVATELAKQNGRPPTMAELLTEIHKRVGDHLGVKQAPAEPQAAAAAAATTTPTGKGASKTPKPGAKPPTSISEQHVAETSGRTRKRSHAERIAAAMKL